MPLVYSRGMDAVVDNRIVARPGEVSMTPSPNNAMNIGELGQVFTPPAVVQAMLAMRQNRGRVLEPSAGDGAFMRAPVPRDWHQARQHLLSVWAESIKRGIATHQRGMPVHFPEFLG